jgi:hypothetical protein
MTSIVVQTSIGHALLTKAETDWLCGNYQRPISKSYEYKMKCRIKNKLRTFQEGELPLLFSSGHFPELAYTNTDDNQGKEPSQGFGDGTLNPCVAYSYSSLGKAKVPGPNPGQGLPIFRKRKQK